MTSAGLGRITGEISRSSDPRPVVASHQSTTTSADRTDADQAARHRRRRDAQREQRLAPIRPAIYLVGRRRFRRVDLDLDPPVLRAVVRIGGIRRAVPAHAGRRELIRLQRSGTSGAIASFTEFARFSDSSCTRLFGTCASHRAVGVPLDHDPRGAVLAGQLADFLDDEADVRIVELLDCPCRPRCA